MIFEYMISDRTLPKEVLVGKLFKPPCVYVCCMYANLKPLCIYAELYLCPCTCPLHPLPEASSNCHGCQAKRGEKKQGCRAAYPGRTQRTKAQSAAALWGCVDYKGSLLLQRSGGETLRFQRAILTGHWFSSRHCMFMDPDISTGNPCIQITAIK